MAPIANGTGDQNNNRLARKLLNSVTLCGAPPQVLTAGPAPAVSAVAAAPAKPRAVSGGGRSITAALSPLPSSLAHAPGCSTPAGQQAQPVIAGMQARWRSLERGLRVKVRAPAAFLGCRS